MSDTRTIAQAIEDAAKGDPTRGFRFVPETGVPGMGGATETSEASFSYTAIERASARYGGALQALGLRKGDRVALILPTNEDFVLCFESTELIIPVPIYPPLGIGQLQSYLDNTRHIVAKSGARALVTSAKIKRPIPSQTPSAWEGCVTVRLRPSGPGCDRRSPIGIACRYPRPAG